jgi:hypothetical protein
MLFKLKLKYKVQDVINILAFNYNNYVIFKKHALLINRSFQAKFVCNRSFRPNLNNANYFNKPINLIGIFGPQF